LCMSWGWVIFGAGFAKKWTDIVVCRLLLGLFEAGFFPGCVYLISCWYTRYEVQKRLAAFYSINIVANGFGSILAYGCMTLSGTNGWLGWRWIFIINGAMTVFLALCGWLLIVDFPDKVLKSRWPFLNAEEVQAIHNKLERDRNDAEFDELTNRKFLQACKRWDLWVYALMFFAVTTIVYGLAFFIPIILQGSLGYSVKKTFLMSAPPAVCAVPWVLFTSWAADKYKMRGPVLVINAITGIIGLMIVAYAENGNARYFGIYVGLAGANANIPCALAFQANNIRGQSLRMIASGFQIAFGAIGGIFGSTVFMQKEFPTYRSGLWAVTGAQLFLILATCLMSFHYWRQNKKADRGEVIIEGLASFRHTF
jgi:MFS family permease